MLSEKDMIVRHHATGLPVVDEGMNLLGIISRSDVLKHGVAAFKP